MNTNSPKPTETGLGEIAAIEVLRNWIDQVGGNLRVPQVLDLLAEHTAKHLQAGLPCPAPSAEELRESYFKKYGGRVPETPASRWLSSNGARTWWDSRREPLEQECRHAGLGCLPNLVITPGGGRGNSSLYRLDFLPLPATEDTDEDFDLPANADLARTMTIRYQVEPAKAVWWLRLIIGNAPFRMRSWRGYLLMGMVVLEGLALLVLWALLLLSLRAAKPVLQVDLGLLVVIPAITWVWWQFMQPILRLPVDRTTVANDMFLGWSQLNAQFRMTRDAKSKVAGGWFQFVRHSSTCSLCAGEVEIASGGLAFPDRLVGRCSDSPLEHVFTFDPVSLIGRLLH